MSRAIMLAGLLVALHTTPSFADESQDTDASDVRSDVLDAANRANVSPRDLLGAMASTGIDDPFEYLYSVREISPPIPVVPARVKCVELKESEGKNVPNSNGSPAGGVMQYNETTFQAHAHEMGHWDWSRWTPWQAEAVAAHDLDMGRRSQWTVPLGPFRGVSCWG